MLRSYRMHSLLFAVVGGVSCLVLAAPGCGGDSGGLGGDGDAGLDGGDEVDTSISPDTRDSGIDTHADSGDDGADTTDTTDTKDTADTADAADTADTTDTADTADTADTTDTADTADTTDTADTPDTALPPGCMTAAWCPVANPSANTLWDIWGSSASNIYAVGNGGTVLQYNGTTWSSVTTGIATTQDVKTIWGSSATDIYVGSNVFTPSAVGTIYHFNGTSWSFVTTMPTGTALSKLRGSAANDIWAVGSGGALLHFNGSTWTSVTGYTNTFTSVVDISSTDTWVFPSGATAQPIRHWNGTAYADFTNPTTKSIFQGFAIATNDIYAPLSTGGAIHWDGTSWSNQTLPTSVAGTTLNSTWASSATDVWLVGANATIINGSKAGFTVVTPPDATRFAFNAVFGFAANDIWVVGAGPDYVTPPVAGSRIFHYKP